MPMPSSVSDASPAGSEVKRPTQISTSPTPFAPHTPTDTAPVPATPPCTSANEPTPVPASGPTPVDPATIIAKNASTFKGVSYAELLRGRGLGKPLTSLPPFAGNTANNAEAGTNPTSSHMKAPLARKGTTVLDIGPTNASPKSAASMSTPKHASSELAQLAAYLKDKTQASILQYCLGIQDFPDAPPLAERIIVICFDTEGWTADSAKITEVGFNTFDTRDTRKVKPGPHGENFLKHTYFYHIRVQPNAHLLNIKYCPGDPTANRFGQTRFLTRSETQGCLNDAFGWPLEPGKPELGYCPVILLGHALSGDLDKLQNTLGWSPQSLGNIVKILDTQQIVRDVGWWNRRDQIGLPAIVARCDFTYRNAHTASNDAAMTTIAAIKMVLPNAKIWDDGKKNKPIQTVIDETEARSQKHGWTWGSPKFCLRCGSRTHMQEDPDIDGLPCRANVRCDHCVQAGRHTASFSHVTERCIQYALAHGNSALAKKSAGEKEAKKARYMRRSSYGGVGGKFTTGGGSRTSGSRVVSEPPPAPYGPGGLFGPPLDPSDVKHSVSFSEKASGPFGNKLNGPFGRKPGTLVRKPEEGANKSFEPINGGGKTPGTADGPADRDDEAGDDDALLT